MKKGIYMYQDGLKNFSLECLQRIDFLKDIEEDAIHDILYNLEAKRYEAGAIL